LRAAWHFFLAFFPLLPLLTFLEPEGFSVWDLGGRYVLQGLLPAFLMGAYLWYWLISNLL
jgi:hypothetical protein